MILRRIYRFALRALPEELRRRHGAAMETLFLREIDRAARGGSLRRGWVAAAGVWDVVRRGVYERARDAKGRTGRRPVRDVGRRWWSLDGPLEDLRHAIRHLRRAPAFALTSVVVLASGVGASSAVLTAFRAVVVEDLPVSDSERLVTLSLRNLAGTVLGLTMEEIDALRRESRTMRHVAGHAGFGAEAIPLSEGERPLVLDMARVTANYFDVLGARPVLGRLLHPTDGEEGAPRVTVISYRTWQRDFGSDPGVVGRRLIQTQYRESYEIVGVAPAGLDHPSGADYWITAGRRDALHVVARLARDISPEAARSEFLFIARNLDGRQSSPGSPPVVATVQSLSDAVLGEARPVLLAMAAAVGLLLLIACVNIGNLLLIRTTQRAHDVTIRRALGATPGGVMRLFVMEGALLGAAARGLGLALATGMLRILPAIAPARFPRTEMIALAGLPVAPAIVLTACAVLLFSILPALALRRTELASALRSDDRSGYGTKARRRVRRLLVGAQVALAVVLLVAAGLLVRSLQRLSALELGYDAGDVAIVELAFNRQGREGAEETFALLEGAIDRLRGLPGVVAATPVMSRPFMGGTGIFQTRPLVDGQPESEAESAPLVPLEVGGHELFRTLGIPIIRGRGLLETDREDAPRAVVVSEAVAQRLWPGEDAVGRRIRMVTSAPHSWTVVGVAGDTRFRQLREATPTIYVPYRQLQIVPGVWTVAVRIDGDLASLVPAMRRITGEFDPRIDMWRVVSLSDHLEAGPLAQPRMSAFILSGFGIAALLLVAVGLYGVISLTVRERTHELGIRKALGASAMRLRKAVLAEALAVTAIGAAVGLGAALMLSRLMVSLLFGVGPADPATIAGVCALLFAVAIAAAFIPATRATRIDPVVALRGD